jgi:hypothetical protein
MKLPFQSELDDLFRSSRGIWLKVAGGAVAGAAVTAAVLLKKRRGAQEFDQFDITEKILVVVGAGVIGAILAIVLSMKDVVERRIEQGKPVNFLLKLYFAFRWVSIVVWFITIMVLVFALTLILLS